MHEPTPPPPEDAPSGAPGSGSARGGPSSGEPKAEGRLGRPRFVEADIAREPGSRARIRVVLELDGVEHVAEVGGVGDEVMVLRLAAEAGLSAIERAIGRPGFFELVGIKRIHAFDDTVVLTCVRQAGEPGQRLLGSVPVGSRSLAEATVLSLLNATNRLVEWLPPPEAEKEEGKGEG